ncbi:MAG: XRE family transcriptional regulator [Deltaproteobacteria bacterium]|nr:MAG: XRE family transcriptional regulator [Deltaproteobacteria bacterium]
MKYSFGNKLRSIREKKQLTLKAVAEKAGVSESLISQIERNKVSPSIDTLLTIAEVLSVDIEYIFSDYRTKRAVSIVREADRNIRTINTVVYQQLSSITSSQGKTHDIEAYIIQIPVGEEKGSSEYGHAGKELGYILKGKGELKYGGDNYIIEKGDSLSFASDIPHKLRNNGKDVLEALWITTPPRLFISK